MANKPTPGTGGDHYIPVSERTGKKSKVYFTRDLSAAGLRKIYTYVNQNIEGKIAIKLHTGEPHGPNIIPRTWVMDFMADLPDANIVETNTYYEGGRDTTEKHRETLKTNGWTFSAVDIMDEFGTTMLPVKDGKWFTEMSVGKGMLAYDSLIAMTHFKGHTQGGFGGSNKNLGIGCADGRIGKKMIHTRPGSSDQWGIGTEEFMERITESTKATLGYFGKHVCFINVMRNMSVSCDCEGIYAQPVVTPNVGIIASTDILAADQASVDLVYAMKPEDSAALRERFESRHGLRQLTYMKEMGMGNDLYDLIDIDNGDVEISLGDAIADVKPWEDDGAK